jgi:putative tricarboxylic transport membrane protein
MRRGEIITAGILAVLSMYMMYKSTELEWGYVSGEGPGGGAWPFWLSAIMLICTVFIAINWVRRTSPPSQSTEPLLDSYGIKMLFLSAAALPRSSD